MTGRKKCAILPMHSQNDILIRGEHLSMDYGNGRVLDDISLEVAKGDFVAITGPNGGGKSTLLKTLLRLVVPTEGRVSYYSEGMETDRLRFGYLPQKSNIDSRFPISVEEVVASGLFGIRKNWRGRYTAEVQEKIENTLQTMGIEQLRRQPIGTLSGGQLQRTLLGRAVIADPEIVVLDEPLSYVDRRFVEQIYRIVEDIAKSATVLLVSHEMNVISEMSNRHWVVDHTLHECHAAHHYMKTECE